MYNSSKEELLAVAMDRHLAVCPHSGGRYTFTTEDGTQAVLRFDAGGRLIDSDLDGDEPPGRRPLDRVRAWLSNT